MPPRDGANLAAASSLSLAPVAASLPPTQVVPMAMAAAATEEGGISAAPAMASVAAVDSCRPLDPALDLLAPPLLRSFPCCLSHAIVGPSPLALPVARLEL